MMRGRRLSDSAWFYLGQDLMVFRALSSKVQMHNCALYRYNICYRLLCACSSSKNKRMNEWTPWYPLYLRLGPNLLVRVAFLRLLLRNRIRLELIPFGWLKSDTSEINNSNSNESKNLFSFLLALGLLFQFVWVIWNPLTRPNKVIAVAVWDWGILILSNFLANRSIFVPLLLHNFRVIKGVLI